MLTKVKEAFLVWSIIFLSMMLRVYRADYYPIHNNDDSLFHVWAGISSFKNIKKPSSLTIFTQNNKAMFWYSQYNNFDIVRRFSFRLEQPYLDQPPLAMFFIALPAKIFGFKGFTQVPQMLVRIPALVASVFSLFLAFILAKKIFNLKVGFLTLIIYGFTPFYIFGHRQSYLENFLTPIFIFTLIILNDYLKIPSKKNLFLLIITSFVSGWIKIVGFGVFLIIGFWLLKHRRFLPLVITFCAGILSFLLYLLYGYLINWEQFKFLLFTQAARGMYLTSFFEIFADPKFYEPFRDGLYVINFIMIFVMLLKSRDSKKIEFLSLNFIFWLILIILTTDPGNPYWYRLPLFPFLSIAGGYYLSLVLDNPTIFNVLPLTVLGFTGIDLLQISVDSLILRIAFLAINSLFLFKYLFPRFQKVDIFVKRVVLVLLIFIFLINSLVSVKYLSSRCKTSNCLLPDRIVVDDIGGDLR